MSINLKSISSLSWPKWFFITKLRLFPWKSLPRFIFKKILAVILSIFFLVVSLLFLGYGFIEITTNTMGVNAQMVDISNLPKMYIGKHQFGCGGTGLFKSTVIKDHVEYKGIFCLYPAWPNHIEPTINDFVKVWPEKKPIIAATPMQSMGWIVSVFFLMVGLVMFEFFLLAWTIH
jgi:hypothetical protein